MMNAFRAFFSVAILLSGMVVSGCGGSPTPVPAPPPPPQTPSKNKPPVGVGGCAAVGGVLPLNQGGQPFYGTLHGGYSSSNSISLSLSYLQHPTAGVQAHNIVGTATMNWPDLMALLGLPTSGQQQIPHSFCVSSAGQNGQPQPGLYAAVDSSVSLILRGTVQVPTYTYSPVDPYYGGGYPGAFPGQGLNLVPRTVTVSIGHRWDCGAVLYNNRLYGCVEVVVGDSYGLRYESQ